MQDRYLNFYRTLGVEPACSWVELKLAYRRLVRRWHPDQRGSVPDAVADEQIKAVNTAFAALSDYYHRNGELPSFAGRGTFRQPNGGPLSPNNTSTGSYSASPVSSAQHARRLRGGHFIFLGVALAIAYAVVSNLLAKTASTEGDSAQFDRIPHTAAIKPTIDVPKQPQDSATSSHPMAYFGPGATIGEVIAAQGPPTRTEDGVWYYGKSRIYFHQGRVTHWEADNAHPLNARFLNTASKPSTAKTFGVGSTKREVREAQGNPLFETDTTWDYGPSHVFFEDGRVTSWEDSPARSLHLRR